MKKKKKNTYRGEKMRIYTYRHTYNIRIRVVHILYRYLCIGIIAVGIHIQ